MFSRVCKDPCTLTTAEIATLNAMQESIVTKDVAARLCISQRTARARIENIMEKLGASSRAEAIAIWRRRAV